MAARRAPFSSKQRPIMHLASMLAPGGRPPVPSATRRPRRSWRWLCRHRDPTALRGRRENSNIAQPKRYSGCCANLGLTSARLLPILVFGKLRRFAEARTMERTVLRDAMPASLLGCPRRRQTSERNEACTVREPVRSTTTDHEPWVRVAGALRAPSVRGCARPDGPTHGAVEGAGLPRSWLRRRLRMRGRSHANHRRAHGPMGAQFPTSRGAGCDLELPNAPRTSRHAADSSRRSAVRPEARMPWILALGILALGILALAARPRSG